MNINLELSKLQGISDQYRALLREAIMNIGIKRSFEIIRDIENDFHDADEMSEKLLLHAALVGITTTLFDAMQDELEGRR